MIIEEYLVKTRIDMLGNEENLSIIGRNETKKRFLAAGEKIQDNYGLILATTRDDPMIPERRQFFRVNDRRHMRARLLRVFNPRDLLECHGAG